MRVWSERALFWSKFCEVPQVALDTAAIARAWNAARAAIRSVLQAKQAAPLESITLSPEAITALKAFEGYRHIVQTLSDNLQQANGTIRVVKEQAAAGNPTALTADVSHLMAVKARHTPEITSLADEYLKEKEAKTNTEQERDTTKTALDAYRQGIFPAYETAINIYLRKFGAGFRLDKVSPANTRGGASCTYNVLINEFPIPVAGDPVPGTPSLP